MFFVSEMPTSDDVENLQKAITSGGGDASFLNNIIGEGCSGERQIIDILIELGEKESQVAGSEIVTCSIKEQNNFSYPI